MQSASIMQNLQRRVVCSNIAAAAELKAIPTDHKEFRKLPEEVQKLSDALDDAYERRDDTVTQRLKKELAKKGYKP